jgi:type IX secretion system PorP/SprF family membrane protein
LQKQWEFTGTCLRDSLKPVTKATNNAQVWILLFLIFIIPGKIMCQDPEFSQFYSNPLYLNPALAGTGECSRIMFNYRNQWPSAPANFVTYSASGDHYFDALSGGVGLMVISDNINDILMNTIRASAIYAYHLKISSDINMNAGFEATFHQQKVNYGDLIFRDMIDPVTGSINPGSTQEVPLNGNSVMAPDFSSGLLLGIKNSYFVGIAVHHLTEPTLSYYSGTDHNLLYRKYTLHGGGRITIYKGYISGKNSPWVISPNILYQYQQAAQQLNFGMYIEKAPLTAGAWYRYNLDNSDGIIFLAGITYRRFKFGYSYDVTLSRLKGTTGGAHEVSAALLVNCDKKRNKPGAIKCPEF